VTKEIKCCENSARLKNVNIHLRALGLNPRIEDGNLCISIASDEEIKSLSHGEVTKPDSITRRSYRPMSGGVYCEKIFGTVAPYQCKCGKYKGVKHRGLTCDKCGIDITSSDVRRERQGHINLISAFVNPLFKETLVEKLGISIEDLDQRIVKGFNDEFLEEIKDAQGSRMLLNALPVLPADLRPYYIYEDTGIGISGISDFYSRIVSRNNRLQKLTQLHSPDVIIQNERRIIRRTLDRLFHNEILKKPQKNKSKQPLQSLTGQLTSILYRFWETNCDYSGYAMPVPDTGLRQDQLRLPIEALFEVYAPKVIRELKLKEKADTIRRARRLMDAGDSSAIEALKEVIREKPLLVTYEDRVSAFYPVIGKYEALGLHPKSCSQFGLKLNGEKVGFHAPLSPEAVKSSRELVGDYVKGYGLVDEAFSSLVSEDYIQPIINMVINGNSIPLSDLEKTLVEVKDE
jgi:DNA-directed RNA polymerase beta' subunit